MRRDWRPTLALIAALLLSFGLTWMGREVGAHVARDAELIAQLTMDERPSGAVHFVSPPFLIDARNLDAHASADAGALDAYEAPDPAAPVIRRYCDALLNRLCAVWSACGCEGTPPHWPFDETEVGTCAEVMRPHCENWSVWTQLREDLARSSIVDEAALVQFETNIAQHVDCNGVSAVYPVLLVNDATEGQPCNQQASYECRDGSDCVGDVCTVLPGQGERCLNEQEEDAEDDPCASDGLCAEGLVCARHRCTPASRFDCILEPLDFPYVECPPGEVFNWREDVARAIEAQSPTPLLSDRRFPQPECMPIGRACTSDAACFRSRCAGERTSVCMQPTTHEHPGRLLRTAAVLDGYQGNDSDLPTASVGEECRSHICAEGLSCSLIAVDDGEGATHGAFVCREPLAEGGDCSGGDCAEGLVCVDVVHNGHCTAPVCETEYLF